MALTIALQGDGGAQWHCEQGSGLCRLDSMYQIFSDYHRYRCEFTVRVPITWVQHVTVTVPDDVQLPVQAHQALSWITVLLKEQHHLNAEDCYWDVEILPDSRQWSVWLLPKTRVTDWLEAIKKLGTCRTITADGLPDCVQNLLPWRILRMRRNQRVYIMGVVAAVGVAVLMGIGLSLLLVGSPWWLHHRKAIEQRELQLLLGREQQLHMQLSQLRQTQKHWQAGHQQFARLTRWWHYFAAQHRPGLVMQRWMVMPEYWLVNLRYQHLSALQHWLQAVRQGPGIKAVRLEKTYQAKEGMQAQVKLTFTQAVTDGA